MDTDRLKGTARQITGSLKEILGRAVGNKQLEKDGRAEKIAGKVQGAVGSAKQEARKPTER